MKEGCKSEGGVERMTNNEIILITIIHMKSLVENYSNTSYIARHTTPSFHLLSP